MKKFLLLIYLLSFGHTQAQTGIKEWKLRLNQAKDDTTRIRFYTQIFDSWLPINTDSAYHYLKKAENLSNLYPNHPVNLKVWNSFVIYYTHTVNNPKRMFYISKVKQLAIKLNDKRYIKIANFNSIVLQSSTGNYYRAIKEYLAFELTLNPKMPQEHKLYFNLYNNLSICYLQLKKNTVALNYVKKSLPYCHSKTDSLRYYEYLFFILIDDLSKIEQIQKSYSQGLKLATELQNINSELTYKLNIGDVYIRLKQYKNALIYTKNALQLAKENGFTDDEALCKQNLGEIYHGLRQYHKAISYFRESILYCRKTESQILLSKALNHISLSYKAIDDYKNAYKSHLESTQLTEEMVGSEKQKMVAELETQYKLNEKQKQIAQTELQNKLQKHQIETVQQQQYILMILLSIVAILFSWAFYNYQRQNTLSIALAQQKQTAELQAEELSKINQTKDKLFAMLAHDLRSPINSLLSSFLLWKFEDTKAFSTRESKSFSKVHYDLENIQTILNNLLQWASMQLKEITPKKETIAINIIVLMVIRQLEHTARQKRITILNYVSEEFVIADEQQIQIVLRNLLNNAIKFTPNGGFIQVSSNIQPDNMLLINIRDTGIGINSELLKDIFKFPPSKVGTEGEKGIGIGLSLSKELIESNQGSISIQSKIEKGTIVSISLKTLKK